ncbi:response regulator transcription factor [Prosthecobacter sp.]|uniref:response regulator n=1 Tax=Prosthecobacter sp. TaxID=1965333 RepID=UPI002ABC2E03|nr:response regulator transcription factor [Prosthecobacter sp.]MDZ4404525.1 response regulator transcription factor [Prosthecobacter sp.]
MQQANWHSNRSGESRVILLVEDHDIYREVVRAALGKYLPDFEMVEAGSVASALPILQSHKVDVMVIDMTLPDGSAVDLVEQARCFIEQGVKVIVFSSHSTADMLPVLSRRDVHGYVSKEQGLKMLSEVILETCSGEMPERMGLAEREPALRMT